MALPLNCMVCPAWYKLLPPGKEIVISGVGRVLLETVSIPALEVTSPKALVTRQVNNLPSSPCDTTVYGKVAAFAPSTSTSSIIHW